MHYLIDGHNLIGVGALPGIDLADPNDEVKLVLQLRQWAASKQRRRVTVYFDGGLPGGKARNLSSSTVKVIFASIGKTADALLIKHIAAVKNPASFTLITSDRKIIQAAEARRMPYQFSETFAAALSAERDARMRSTAVSDTADEPQMSAGELAEWLELFGPEPERPSPKPRPPSPKAEPPSPKKRPTSLDEAKRGTESLDDDELDEWLRIFGGR